MVMETYCKLYFWHPVNGVGQCGQRVIRIIIDWHDGYSTHPCHCIMMVFSDSVDQNP
jgi:hypothetical protein